MSDAAHSINSRIARQVRHLRSEQSLSLASLASTSGVSRSMLSLVERGESSPTAVVLEKIAAGLGVPLTSLFENPTAPLSPIARSAQHVPWKDPQSGYVRRNLSPDSFPSPLRLVQVELPPGASVAYEGEHRDVTIHQQLWVLTGTIEVSVGKATYRLEVDDCLAMDLNAPTAFRNRTRKSARYLVAITHGRHRPAS